VRKLWLMMTLLCALLPARPAVAEPPPEAVATVRLARAQETRAFTERSLQYLAGAPDCPRAVFVSYATSSEAPQITSQWYDVSQIRADLALAPPGDPLARCWAFRGFTFVDRLWDRATPSGGFFARADLAGEDVLRPDKFVDDNSLAGLAWMEAALSSADRLERQLMLGRAQATADFLMSGGVWDDTFGGGFWWNTTKGAAPEGKPAQTNGLAAEFFLQLYGLTGEPVYREWAEKTLAWLDTRLYDLHGGLYRWNVHYADLQRQQGEVVSDRFFNYDQGVLIEANLLAYQQLGEDQRYYQRAWSLGRRIDPVFWDQQRGGYNLEAGIPQVVTVYSAWLSQSFLMLYAVDRDPYWLERASANVDALNATLWDPANGGYYHRHYVCRDPGPPGCAGGASWSFDPAKHTVDQAWMQRVQALLATSLVKPDGKGASGQ
jgi:hypothetical protein